MKKTGVKKKKREKLKTYIFLGLLTTTVFITVALFLLKYKNSFSGNNNSSTSARRDSSLKENKDNIPNITVYEKPKYLDISDSFGLNITPEDESILAEKFKNRNEFLKTNKIVNFKELGPLSFEDIEEETLSFFVNKLNKDPMGLYLLHFPVLNIAFPKIDWTKENCDNFSLELKWLKQERDRNSAAKRNLSCILYLLLKLLCIEPSDLNNLTASKDHSKYKDSECFDIYKKDLVVFLDHFLTNTRFFFGRPRTLKIIEIIWENMPLENNFYAEFYKKVMTEAVGVEPLFC